MKARYLLRFDDLCPTMNWQIWADVEKALLEYELKPLLAVVPDNQDSVLQAGPARPDFWGEVRKWQARGWTIGLHGYQHACLIPEGGMLGIARRGEFAGLPQKEQRSKLQKAVDIFRSQLVKPEVWVAPAHSFDQATLAALQEVGIGVISDGFALAPYQDAGGLLWVPQQLWRCRWRPFGIWTVCYHHNRWTREDVAKFRRDLRRYGDSITSLSRILGAYSGRTRRLLDDLCTLAHSSALFLRRSRRPSP